jgi:hypothetical protein
VNEVEAWRLGRRSDTWNPSLSIESFHGPIRVHVHPTDGLTLTYGSTYIYLKDEQVLALRDYIQRYWGEEATNVSE